MFEVCDIVCDISHLVRFYHTLSNEIKQRARKTKECRVIRQTESPETKRDTRGAVRPAAPCRPEEMAKCYEVVVFTASLSKYADPLLDMLDKVGHRIFRGPGPPA